MQKWNLLVMVFFVCILVGCARSSVTRIGSETFSPLVETANVFVYSNESEVRRPFVAIGIVSLTDPGKYQVLTLDDAIPKLKAKARSFGANGIIIDQNIPIKSGIISTGISVKARAIRIHMEE